MTSYFKKIIIFLSSFFILHYSLFTHPVLAQTGVYEEDVVSFQWLEVAFGNVLSIMLGLIGLAAFVMILVGAFGLLTAGANQEAVQKGQRTLTFGILGIFLALLIWFLFYFIAQFTGANILEFKLDI